MAAIDRRLIPLIETLTAVGADWLAFELIDGIRRGRETEETPDALASSRRELRNGEQPKATGEPKLIAAEPQPIVGDDQIEWATQYVADRLNSTLEELAACFENLDAILDGEITKTGLVTGEAAGVPLIVLALGEDQLKVDRSGADQSRSVIPKLRLALESWSSQVRGQTQI